VGQRPGHTPPRQRPSQDLDWEWLAGGDCRRWRFRGSQDDLLALHERGQRGEPVGGGTAQKWSPEHHRRWLPAAVHSGQPPNSSYGSPSDAQSSSIGSYAHRDAYGVLGAASSGRR
jgi:hypothetical protein